VASLPHPSNPPAIRRRGFSLLEVLLAFALAGLPVVAAQRLMVHATVQTRLAAERQHAVQAAHASWERIYAFHVHGLWPQQQLAAGVWVSNLAGALSSEADDGSLEHCVNRWCAQEAWAAYELAILQCALAGQPQGCGDVSRWSEPSAPRSGLTQTTSPRWYLGLRDFHALIAVEDGLSIEVSWPVASAAPALEGSGSDPDARHRIQLRPGP